VRRSLLAHHCWWATDPFLPVDEPQAEKPGIHTIVEKTKGRLSFMMNAQLAGWRAAYRMATKSP
jgi:hypothetical protein